MVWQIDSRHYPALTDTPGLLVALPIFAAGVLAAIWESLDGLASGWVFVSGALIGPWGAVRWWRRRAVGRFLRALQRGGAHPDAQAFADALSVARGAPLKTIARLIRTFAPGVAAIMIEVCDPDFVGPPKPLKPFLGEFPPTPLSDADPLFQTLSSAPASRSAFLSKRMGYRLRRELNRSSPVLVAIGAILLVALVPLFLVVVAAEVLTSARYPWLVWPALVLGLIVVVAWLFRSEEWLLVPGGMIIRRAGWRSDRWQLIELHRDDCTLLFWPEGVAIASDEVAWTCELSPVELETLLRGWFSDAPRQPLERMSDLQ